MERRIKKRRENRWGSEIGASGTLRRFALCPSGHLIGGYVARSRSLTQICSCEQTSHIPGTLTAIAKLKVFKYTKRDIELKVIEKIIYLKGEGIMPVCKGCNQIIGDNEEKIQCPNCHRWYHKRASCLDARYKEYAEYRRCDYCGSESRKFWMRFCPYCGTKLYEFCPNCMDKFGYSKGGCHITKVVCYSLGLSDDCHELNELRRFRDEYLNKKGYNSEVEEYYTNSTVYATRIELAAKADSNLYITLYERFIKPAVLQIEANNMEGAHQILREYLKFIKEECCTNEDSSNGA